MQDLRFLGGPSVEYAEQSGAVLRLELRTVSGRRNSCYEDLGHLGYLGSEATYCM